MNNSLTIKDFKRIIAVANDHAVLRETLNSLKNAWMLCDTEYCSAVSEHYNTVKEISAMKNKIDSLHVRRKQLEDEIFSMGYAVSIDSKDDVELYNAILSHCQ